MRHAPMTLHFSHRFPAPAALPGAIEWEELPSLAEVVRERARRGASRQAAPTAAWDSTRPAEFEPAPRSAPFREPIEGVGVREVLEPDVFRHFFGA